MGMAASQARLLSITARIHDVEYQAQSIQNAKLQLAIQEDRAYSEYNDALAATTLTVLAMDNTGQKSTIPVTFDNLFGRNRVTVANGDKYALFEANTGAMIVDNEIYEAYTSLKANGVNDPYVFATYMAMEENPEAWVNGIGTDTLDDEENSDKTSNADAIKEALLEAEEAIFNTKGKDNEELKNYHEQLEKLVGNDASNIYDTTKLDPDDKDKYESTLNAYRALLYKNYTIDIANEAGRSDGNDEYNVENYGFNQETFNYYLSIFKQIEENGGKCVSIDDYDGSFGDASNNSEWIQAMVESGRFIIKTFDEKNGDVEFSATSVGSDTCLKYTETSSIDKTALAKAEAEYEHKMRQIDKKDKQYDLTLSKLETERQALTTEHDSIKKVIQENIQRTFGIFS